MQVAAHALVGAPQHTFVPVQAGMPAMPVLVPQRHRYEPLLISQVSSVRPIPFHMPQTFPHAPQFIGLDRS